MALDLEPVRLLSRKPNMRARFQRFADEHGGNPIEIDGKLVFPDGWSYSATSYAGPEWPPPPTLIECRALLRRYWLERKAIVVGELALLRESPHQLRADVDEAALAERIDWLTDDVSYAAEMLESLTTA